jgi:hypothetical protein
VDASTYSPDDALAVRLVTAPGVVRAGAGCWDRGRTPIHPLTLEYACADPKLLRDLGFACAVATESVSTYLHVLDLAAHHGTLAPIVHELSVSAIVDRWAEDDPRWEVLIAAV